MQITCLGKYSKFGLLLFGLVSFATNQAQPVDTNIKPAGKLPNILLIVADDLGFSDLTPFGGEIPTPALDDLARAGIRLASFYSAPTCSPARSMLFSGVDNHLAGIGTMSELLDRYPELQNQPGYEGYLTDKVLSLPDVLRRNGYRTYMAGKWHLGEKAGQWPVDRGFDRSFALLQAGASHYDSRVPLFPMPKNLVNTVQYVEDNKEVPIRDDFYSSRDFADHLIQYLGEHKTDAPFFAYLPFTAPHDPLHAPEAWSAKFKGRYDEGYDKLQQQRLSSLKKLGFFPADTQSAERMPHVKAWATLDKETRRQEAKKMEIYAGMIAYMDHQIGRVVDVLKERGLYENTLIVFFSDNGASGHQYEGYPRTEPDFMTQNFDNSVENWGKKGSRIAVGSGWAHASMVPFRLFKAFTAEGGIRSPMIVAGPGIQRTGEIDLNTVAHIMDIAPTFYEVAGIDPPTEIDGIEMPVLQGKSMLTFLEGADTAIHDDYIGWELFGGRAIRHGDWKLLWVRSLTKEPARWELFNIAQDPTESQNLIAENPKKVLQLKAMWQDYVKRNGVITLP